MREISLHILDVAHNSLRAKASLVKILVAEDRFCDRLVICIDDNGYGMSESMVKQVLDPFVTTRTTRKVGLGLPLFKAAAERCGGDLVIQSVEGKGTSVFVYMQSSHIDRAPLGDMAETIVSLMCHNPETDIVYHRVVDDRQFVVDSREVKQQLEDIPINNLKVIAWLKEYLAEAEVKVGGAGE